MSDDKRNVQMPKATIGDMINIKGYGSTTFQVFSVMHEIYVDAEVSYEEIYYDCYCDKDNQYYYADDEDVTVVSRPDDVDYDKLKEYTSKVNEDWTSVSGMMDEIAKIEKKVEEEFNDVRNHFEKESNEHKTKNKREKIDDLLVDLYDVNSLIRNFGEHEDDEKRDRKYVLKKNEIEAKLKEITEEGSE